MNISKDNIKRLFILISSIILTILIIGLLSNKLSFIDNLVYNFIISFKSNYMTIFFKIITFFASIEWFVLLIVFVFIFNKNKKINYIMLIYLFGIALITFFMKNLFLRDRPFDLMLIEEVGYSFPSGHSSISLAFYGFISYLVYKSDYTKRSKFCLIICLLFLSLLIGISRIYLGVHYPTDVLAGFMVGIIYFMVFILVYDIRKKVKI